MAAPGRPEERFVGEGPALARAAERHGVPVEAVMHPQTDEMDAVRWDVRDELLYAEAPETDEYLRWSEESARVEAAAARLLEEFYAGREVEEDVRLAMDRSGRIRNGGGIYDRAWRGELSAEDRAAIPGRLPAYQAEMDRFAAFLKERFLRS